MGIGAMPRVWLEEAFDALPAAERRNGDVAVCLNSTVTPTFKIWRGGAWHVGVAQSAELTVTVSDPYGLSGLQGLYVLTETIAEGRHIALVYNDGGTQKIIAERTDPL